jgi:hypothetical protein
MFLNADEILDLHFTVRDLFKAVNDVPKEYINIANLRRDRHINYVKDQIESWDTKISKGTLLDLLDSRCNEYYGTRERNFCYELYFVWKGIIANKKKVDNEEEESSEENYSNLILNGEIYKTNLIQCFEIIIKENDTIFFDFIKRLGLLKQSNFSPDFTLHGGQGDIEHQELIVEVKTDLSDGKIDEIIKDIFKLFLYKSLFKFKHAVFIVVNINIDTLKKYLSNKDLMEFLKKGDDITVIIRDENSTNITTIKKLVSHEKQ